MSFDTRRKIVGLEEARAAAAESKRRGLPVTAFVTHMDVLLASHVRKLQEFAFDSPGALFMILTDPASPLVPLMDRAHVAAGLRTIDYVVPARDGAGPALAAINPSRIIHDEEEDRGRTRELIEHVRRRSRN